MSVKSVFLLKMKIKRLNSGNNVQKVKKVSKRLRIKKETEAKRARSPDQRKRS